MHGRIVTLMMKIVRHMARKQSGNAHAGMLLAGDPGLGKAQPLDSKIKTPNGWMTMGEASVGDLITAPDGTITEIVGTYPQGKKDIYKVTFVDGRTTRACGEHLWKVRKMRTNQWEIINTLDIKHYLDNTQRWLYVPMITPTEIDVELPIDPYLVGSLLGDGSLSQKNGLRFSTGDEQMVNVVNELLSPEYCLTWYSNYDYGLVATDRTFLHKFDETPRLGTYYNKYLKKLDQLNLLGTTSSTKFIPEIYKTGSRTQKEQLIAGLVDTDGDVHGGAISISTSSFQLAQDIQEVVRSIGGWARCVSRIPTFTYQGEKKQGQRSYKVSIRYHDPKALSRLDRKLEQLSDNYQYSDLQLRITNIEFDGVEEAKCIKVAHPDQLYITDNYVVTHNTTVVNLLGAVLGLKTITIEIPHIVEEHLINIPFLVFDPSTNSTKQGTEQVPTNYKLVLAQSNLFTQIMSVQPMSDLQYLEHIKQSPAEVQHIFMQLGGTETEIPKVIANIRASTKSILFLDEYYRQTSMRVRNVLRDILNNRIGMHKIPTSVYLIFASNMDDPSGLETEIPSNNEFSQIEFKAPTKGEWFDWFIRKFEKDPDVKLNEQVIKKFQELLVDEDISYRDVGVSVRTSPRRWEQLLLYIASSLPTKDIDEARAILTNVKNNFAHYQTEQMSDLGTRIVAATEELIKDTSGFTQITGTTDYEWRVALLHLVKQQMQTGGKRKHIPVVSGSPGLGKEQPLYSKIKTPTGWTTMGEISIGDVVSTPDGGQATVTGRFPQGKKEIFRFTFADGRTADAGDEHLWKVRKSRSNDWKILTTHEIRRIIDETNQWMYVPLVTQEQTVQSDVELPIDPYVLGCLLGDGGISTKNVMFTSSDQEIIDSISERLDDGYALIHSDKYDYRLVRHPDFRDGIGQRNTKGSFRNLYIKKLTELNLRGTKSSTKFIPEIYKNGSHNQKIQLIAGLVDTDGYVRDGAMSISTSSFQLVQDIQEVVRSIGGWARCVSRIPTFTCKGEKKQGQRSYTVSLRYHNPKALCHLSRKAEQLSENYQYSNLNLRITNIESIGFHEAQCIMIDHPDHLYITDNYVVTHNTMSMQIIANKLDLRLIDLDVSGLSAEDVTGMPIPASNVQEDMAVKFSRPKLYEQIMRQIQIEDAQHLRAIADEHGSNANQYVEQYNNSRWKYLIFFDELNRVNDERTMNALRRVILEKNFGPDDNESGEALTLPKEAIIVAAINPVGGGTTEFTEHFRDVLDFVPTKANWNDTKRYLRMRKFPGIEQPVINASMDVIQSFVDKFMDRSVARPAEQAPFYLDVGFEMTISPREYTDLYTTMVDELNATVDQILDEQFTREQAIEEIKNTTSEVFADQLRFIFKKHGYGEAMVDFGQALHTWIHNLDPSTFGDMFSRIAETSRSYEQVLGDYLNDKNVLSMPDDVEFTNVQDKHSNAQIVEQTTKMLADKIHDQQSAEKYILDVTHPKVIMSDGQLATANNEHTSLLENFINTLLFTLKIHEFQNDRLQAVSRSLRQASSAIVSRLRTQHKIDPQMEKQIKLALIKMASSAHSFIIDDLTSVEPQ